MENHGFWDYFVNAYESILKDNRMHKAQVQVIAGSMPVTVKVLQPIHKWWHWSNDLTVEDFSIHRQGEVNWDPNYPAQFQATMNGQKCKFVKYSTLNARDAGRYNVVCPSNPYTMDKIPILFVSCGVGEAAEVQLAKELPQQAPAVKLVEDQMIMETH